MASFGEILEEFKSKESAEMIIPLIDDNKLRNGLAAWQSAKIKHKEMQNCDCKDDLEKWEWLWSRINYSLDEFGVVAGVNPREVSQLFVRLKGLRLIYPDGTINKLAKLYLQGLIMAKLPSKKRKVDEE